MTHQLASAIAAAVLVLNGTIPAQPSAAPPTRLIDVHLHAWEKPPGDPEFREALEDGFNRYHLERAIVSGPADAARAAVALDPKHLVGGAADGAGPILPPLSELRADFQSGRFGVLGEIDVAWDGERLTAARLKAYWTLADSMGIPVALFTGVAPPGTHNKFPHYRVELGRPGQLEPVLADHPRLRVDLMQAGWPYREETIALMHEHQYIYADLGNLVGNQTIPREEFYDYLRALLRAGLGHRIMFGSGLALADWPDQIGALVAALQEAPFLTDEERDNIFFRNAADFMRLGRAPEEPPRR